MPTIFTHPAVPLGLSPWFRRLPRSLVVLAAIASAVPDVDVLSFRFHIPYESPLGHRGLTHSLLFAFTLALLLALPYRPRFARAFTFLFLAIASHGLLDAMTNGGKGVGFFIPFSPTRYFLPWRPIRVSPIGATNFAGHAGAVLRSELLWVWVPVATMAVIGYGPVSRLRRRNPAGATLDSRVATQDPNPRSRTPAGASLDASGATEETILRGGASPGATDDSPVDNP